MVHRDGNGGRLQMRKGIERDLPAIRKCRGGLNEVCLVGTAVRMNNLLSAAGFFSALLQFQHYVILVQLRKHGRHFALPVSVV